MSKPYQKKSGSKKTKSGSKKTLPHKSVNRDVITMVYVPKDIEAK